MSTAIHFLGAAKTVTGTRHLVEHNGKRILMDCGLFQGRKEIRKRNWQDFGVDPKSIDAVVLSHAHIDHSGWLPRLLRMGFNGPIYCTPATRDLAAIMLPDSARIQEEDARYANRKKITKHNPALPLYTERDAVETIRRMRAVPYATPKELLPGISLTLRRAGHILGSASIDLQLDKKQRVVFSGDLGRYDTPIICDPSPVPMATALLVECTYGDRRHNDHDPQANLAKVIKRTVQEKRVLIIPAFAIGRTQHILYLISQLQRDGKIPELPVFVDSPMACNATPLYLMHRDEHDDEMSDLILKGEEPIYPKHVHFVRTAKQSKEINHHSAPMVIIAASGMATGGRVLHHLRQHLSSPKTTVLFAGYQAYGTRGRKLLEGDKFVRIHGRDIEVDAEIGQIYGFSGHADYQETSRWLQNFESPPDQTFCIHGELDALEATQHRLKAAGWNAHIPDYKEVVEL